MSFGEDRIIRKSPEEIEKMRRSGKMVRQVLNHLKTVVAAGVTTMDLERAAEKLIAELGAAPAFKGYYGYPCVLCASINEEIVHGIPSEKRVLKTGDIVSLDCGVVYDGYYGCLLYTSRRTEIPRVLGGMGINILTTPKGVMTGRQARREGLGGELLCEIW